MKVEVYAGEFDTTIQCVGCDESLHQIVTAQDQDEARKTAANLAMVDGWEDTPRGVLCPKCQSKDDGEDAPRNTKAARMSKTRTTQMLRRRKDGDEEG